MAELTSGDPVIATASKKKNRELVGKLLTATLVAAALYLFGSGFADNKSSPGGLPAGIEAVSPANLSTNVPKQSTISADLEFGYTGFLTITGRERPTEIPLDQLSYVRSTGMLSFTPGEGKEFNRLPGDSVRVTVTYWPEAKTRETAGKEFTWTFNVL